MTDEMAPQGYREIAPPPQLQKHVVCFWSHPASPDRDPQQQIIPDGCIDILWVGHEAPFVAGMDTAPRVYTLPDGADIFGLRLRPGLAGAFLGLDAFEVRDADVPLRDIWRPKDEALWAPLGEVETVAGRVRVAEALLTRRLHDVEDDPAVSRAVGWLATHPFSAIAELDARSGLSDRQLRRRFYSAVGYGPKFLQRVLRLQFYLWLAGRGRERPADLASLAAEAGYADQAHLTREVGSLTGATPSRLLSRPISSTVSDLFKTT